MAKIDWEMHIEIWQESRLPQATYFSQRLRVHRAAPVMGPQALITLRVEVEAPAAGSLVVTVHGLW